MEIKHIKWGLANNYLTHIEINEDLLKYPKLYNYVLQHELGHIQKFDIHHDFKFKLVPVVKLLFFCIGHPRTLVDLIPIQKKGNEWFYDINLIILYLIMSLLAFLFL